MLMLLSGCSYDRKATFFMEYSICGLFAESEAHILDLNEKLPCSKQWHVHHNIVQLCFDIEATSTLFTFTCLPTNMPV